MSEEEEKGLGLAKLIGALFVLVGLILLVVGAIHVGLISQLQQVPELTKLAQYLSSVGAITEFTYGILAIALGIGLMKEEEWAAGGSFVLLIVIIINLGSYLWYAFNFGILTTTAYLATAIVVLSIIIMIYLVWARGWK